MAVIACSVSARICGAQETSAKDQSKPIKQTTFTESNLRSSPRTIAHDQLDLWTSPFRLRAENISWVVPVIAGATLAFATDSAIEGRVSRLSGSTVRNSATLSTAGLAGFATASLGAYTLGRVIHNPELASTGLLSAEAMTDTLVASAALKAVTRRDRPGAESNRDFFSSHSPLRSSFPSQHAALAWAAATVFAHQYPGVATQFVSYGAASAVAITRVTGRKHSASDVLIGSALGWYVGSKVVKRRSGSSDEQYGTFSRREVGESSLNVASSYVPIDSWIYEAFARLVSMGAVNEAMLGLRPWTRLECARLLDSIGEDGNEEPLEPGAQSLVDVLSTEFASETNVIATGRNVGLRIDSVYSRALGMSGPNLHNEMYFGETITNDFGRPYGRGLNSIAGFTASGERGPIGFFFRGEYQHAPQIPPLPDSARAAMNDFEANLKELPPIPASIVPAVNHVIPIEAYINLGLADWQLSFGKQTMWWGPGQLGDLMMSNNAAAFYALRLSRTTGAAYPGILRLLGPVRTDAFLGQLRGYHFLRVGSAYQTTGSWTTVVNPQPYIFGSKVSLKPTENLELGFSMTIVLGGMGRPMTLKTFGHAFSSSGNNQAVEPGDRRTGFDFAYRLPGLRRWVTIYNGSLADDEPNPIAYPRRSAMNPGVYLTRFPLIPRLDLRVEAVYTDLPGLLPKGFFYTNLHYQGGYTNEGRLMGSWIGPEAHGGAATSTYWFGPQHKLQFFARRQVLDREFVQGGNLTDYGIRYDHPLTKDLHASARFQLENWNYPALAPQPQNNRSLALQLTYAPKRRPRDP